MGAAPTFESKVHLPNKNKLGVQVLILDIDNGNRVQAEAFRQVTGATAPMLMQAGRGDYGGARMEDIAVIDQNGILRYTTNWVDGDHDKINQAIDALLNKYPIITFSSRTLYLGHKLKVGQSRSATLQVSNVGEAPLDITGYTAPEGIIVTPSTFSLGINESASIEITLIPIASGSFSGDLILNHNDENAGQLHVPINGLTIEPSQIPTVEVPINPHTDFDGSGKVDFADFLSFAQAFGTTNTTYDLNSNTQVDFGDFLIFVQNFGKEVK